MKRVTLVLTGIAVVGCASGGGGPPVSGPEAEALYASYSGTWTMDPSSSTAQIPNQFEGMEDQPPVEDISRNESREMRRYRRMIQNQRMSVSRMRATVEVLRRRPETLVLRLTAAQLAYTPTPGETLMIPMDGTEVETREGEERVRSKIGWEGPFLVIEHQVVGGARVREMLEAVGDRLIMTRSLSTAEAGEPLILAYDRQ